MLAAIGVSGKEEDLSSFSECYVLLHIMYPRAHIA